jgi:hypothetical protein
MSVPALRKHIAAIEHDGFFRVADARALKSEGIVGKRVSAEEYLVLSLFKDRVDAGRVDSSPQARRVLNHIVAQGPSSAMADGAAIAVGAAKKGALFGLAGALVTGTLAAFAASAGHYGPWAHFAAEHAFNSAALGGGLISAAVGAVKGAIDTKKALD